MADGNVRVKLGLDSSEVEADLGKLDKIANDASKKIASAFEKMTPKGASDEMQRQNTAYNEAKKNVDELTNKLQLYENQIADVEAKMAKLRDVLIDQGEIQTRQSLGRNQDKIDEWVDKTLLADENFKKLYDTVHSLYDEIDNTSKQLDYMNDRASELEPHFNILQTALAKAYEYMQPLSDATSIWNKAMQHVKNTASSISSKFKSLIPAFDSAKNSSIGFGNSLERGISRGLKSIKRLGLGILGIRSAFSAVRRAVNIVLQDNEELSNKMNALWQGLASIIAPIVEYVVNGIGKIMAMVNALFKAFTGKDLFKPFTKAATSTKKMADNTGKVADNLEEAKNQLASFDQMNVLSDQSSKGSGSGGSGAGDGGLDIGGMFDVGNFDVSAIKAKLEELFEPIKNAWDKYGEPLKKSFMNALDSIKKTVVEIGKSFETVWLNGTGQKTCELILQILISVLNTITNISDGFRNAWVNADTGTKIVQNLWNTLNNILALGLAIIQTFENWFASSKATQFWNDILSIVETLSGWLDNLTNNLVGIWENGGSHALNSLLDAFSNAVDVVDKLLEALDPLVTTIEDDLGDAFAWVLDKVGDLIDKFNEWYDWITGNRDDISGFALILGSVATAIVLVNGAIVAFNAIAAICTGVMAALSAAGGILAGVIGFITSPIGITVAAIAGLIAIGTLLWKNWDTISQKGKEIWNGIWSFIKDKINKVSGGIEKFINGIIDGFNNMIKAVNKLQFNVPNWIPVIGGNKFGLNIGTLSKVKIPKLARGAIVNTPTQFIAGEAGKEAVLPLQNNTEWMDELAAKLSQYNDTNNDGTPAVIVFNLDGTTLYKKLIKIKKQQEFILG